MEHIGIDVDKVESQRGPLVFPAANGSQRSAEADPQKILRTALARAGLVEGYQHVCRWCGHTERHVDNEQRYCPKCLKRTNGTGKPLAQPRGRALWPKAIPRPMRFHDLRHTTATLLLRAGVDAHRVQRLLRHRDVRTTTTIYGHLDVEDLRAALEKTAAAGSNLGPSRSKRPGTACEHFGERSRFSGPYMVGAAGFEPATPAV